MAECAPWPTALVHTCVRVRDADASVRFYRALGFEERGRLNFESAYNVYMGLPGDGDRLELTVNVGREEPYDLGDGYNHFAVTVEDIDARRWPTWPSSAWSRRSRRTARAGATTCRASPSCRIPTATAIELIDGGAFATPQDGPHPRPPDPGGPIACRPWRSARASVSCAAVPARGPAHDEAPADHQRAHPQPRSRRSPTTAFLSDCETTALVAPSGNVEWLCLPRMDSPERVRRDPRPRRRRVPARPGRRAGPGRPAATCRARWCSRRAGARATGWIIVRDVLLIGPWHHDDELSHTHRRAPTDYDADHVLLRTVRCVNGEVQVVLDCEPMFDYGRRPRAAGPTPTDGYHEAVAPRPRASTSSCGSPPTCDLGFEGARATARTLLKEGDDAFCALSWSEHEPPHDLRRGLRPARSGPPTTGSTGWPAATSPTTRGAAYLQRSALTLKGLTFAPTGALVAAATTSLPETPGGERNWDYRYTWIRDSTFALWGLYTLGFDWEANDFFYFIADVAERDEELQIMYGVDGERDLTERTLDHLHGYEGARPVRIGNGAYDQHQHDVWGAVLDSVYLHTRSRDRLDERLWPILKHAGRDGASATGASPTAASGRCAASRSTSPPRR